MIVTKDMGYVADIFTSERLTALTGHAAIGHTRYSTAGDSGLANAQPILIDCAHGQIAIAHNGNLVNAQELKDHLVRLGSIFQTSSDTEVILHLSRARGRRRWKTRSSSRSRRYARVLDGHADADTADRGARSARVPPAGLGKLAIRGGVLGNLRDGPDRRHYVRDVERVSRRHQRDGLKSYKPFAGTLAHCVFAHVYFARPDSYVFAARHEIRTNRDERWHAKPRSRPMSSCRFQTRACVPPWDSPEQSAPMRMGLIRNHYVGRTFIQPQQSIRHFGVRVKLNPVRSILEGQRVILVDDSIVRGTTSRKIVRMVKAAGAKEVHMRISCPPTISPCFYGVDTPRRSELIAATHTLEEIRRYLDATSLMLHHARWPAGAVGQGRSSYCTSCYTGQYPVEFPRNEAAYLQLTLKPLEQSATRHAVSRLSAFVLRPSSLAAAALIIYGGLTGASPAICVLPSALRPSALRHIRTSVLQHSCTPGTLALRHPSTSQHGVIT